MSDNMFESFGEKDDSKAGQDLYLKILKKTAINPENEAVKNIAGRYGMTQNRYGIHQVGQLSAAAGKKADHVSGRSD